MDIADDKLPQSSAQHGADDAVASALADTRCIADINMKSKRLSIAMAALTSSSSSVSSKTAYSSSSHSSTPSASPPSTPPLQYDLNISNGTCYYAPNEPMDPGFIPCGNAASDTKPCCWKGDVCLGDDACFGVHQGVYTTYMGGCTDGTGTLVNNKCPQKPNPYASEPWIGLAYCNGTSDEWIACPQEESPSVIKGAGPCVCPAVTQQRIVAFRDASVLPSYASLPTAAGGSIKWLGGYTPTVGTVDGPTGTSTPDNSVTRGSRVPLVVGLSVGISGVVLLALAGVIFLYRKRTWKDKSQVIKSDGMDGNGSLGRADGDVNDVVACSPPRGTDAPQTTSMAISELEMRPARPWSMRSELDGDFPVAVAGASTTGHGVDGPRHVVLRMSSGRVYGSLSPTTTGPSQAEALDEVSTQRTGMSSVSAQTPLHTGQTIDSRRHPSMYSINDRRPPFETLVELE